MVAVAHRLEQGIAIVHWPEESEMRAALRARRMPRLLVVADGVTPPSDVDVIEDWVGVHAPAAEIEARLATLATRAQRSDAPAPVPALDDDDVLHVGAQWIALGPIEARLARPLVASFGSLVPRAELERIAWDGRPVRANTTDRQLHRLRAHVARLGLSLVTVRGRGYVLDVSSPSA